MSEYLDNKCISLGIRLVYTYNKSTVLSVEINKEKPLLIADMLFKNCPDSVSKAIIGYFTDTTHKSSYEKIIKSFVEDYFKPSRPGNIKYTDLSYLVKSTPTEEPNYKNNHCKIEVETEETDDYDYELKDPGYQAKQKNYDYETNFDMDNTDITEPDVDDSNMIELGIYHIDAKTFWGDEKRYMSSTSIKPLKDDELQLNIVVLPPVT